MNPVKNKPPASKRLSVVDILVLAAGAHFLIFAFCLVQAFAAGLLTPRPVLLGAAGLHLIFSLGALYLGFRAQNAVCLLPEFSANLIAGNLLKQRPNHKPASILEARCRGVMDEIHDYQNELEESNRGLASLAGHHAVTNNELEITKKKMEQRNAQLVAANAKALAFQKELEKSLEKLRSNAAALKESVKNTKRANTELEQFAQIVSHDLQEPLRTIGSYTQILARRYKGKLDKDADEFIGFVTGGVKRMSDLITDLLIYSKEGQRDWEPATVDCNQVIEEVLVDLKTAIEEKGAVIKFQGLPTVRADRNHLVSLFTNLLSNAIKFSNGTPEISVAAHRTGGEWVFSVADNGIGISPKHHGRIFLIFKRLHTREEYPGTGIGLAICAKIIARHGGRIWVESEEGKGTTFRFTLPAEKETTA